MAPGTNVKNTKNHINKPPAKWAQWCSEIRGRKAIRTETYIAIFRSVSVCLSVVCIYVCSNILSQDNKEQPAGSGEVGAEVGAEECDWVCKITT